MSDRMVRVLILICALLAPVTGATPRAEASGPLVLAFYYAWYDMNTWSSGQLSDLPQQPYVSADVGTIDRHVRQARAAGIDGLVQSWYGPGGGNQTEGNLKVLLDVAAAHGLRVAVDFEVASPYFSSSEDRVAALRHLLAVHANHSAYLRVDGRPVVFFWAWQQVSLDEWAAIRAEVDPEGASLWIVEGAAIDALAVFDGLHLYNIAWSDNPAGTLANWGGQVRAKAEALGAYRYWVATVMPGWDDTRIAGRTGAFVRNRAGGDYYRRTWAGAVASGPDMVIITSFNEWMEGSMIEPSAGYGDFYLELTRELAAAYKAGLMPAVVASSSPTPAESPTADAEAEATVAMTVTVTEAETGVPASWPTPRADGAIVHVVEADDTLIWIAVRYGVSVEELLALNGLERSTILRIGQEIIVAVVPPTPVVVPTATWTPSPTVVPAIRSPASPTATRPPTEARPTNTPVATARVEDMPMPSPAPAPGSALAEGVAPWPAVTIGALLLVAIWLLLRPQAPD